MRTLRRLGSLVWSNSTGSNSCLSGTVIVGPPQVDSTLTLHSEYSLYTQGNMLASSGASYAYGQTGPADLHGAAWDTTGTEGSQNFHGDSSEEYSFQFGHITPRGHGESADSVDELRNYRDSLRNDLASARREIERLQACVQRGEQVVQSLDAAITSRTSPMASPRMLQQPRPDLDRWVASPALNTSASMPISRVGWKTPATPTTMAAMSAAAAAPPAVTMKEVAAVSDLAMATVASSAPSA